MERDSKPFDCRDPIPLLVALKNFRPECALATGKAVGLVSCLPVNARRPPRKKSADLGSSRCEVDIKRVYNAVIRPGNLSNAGLILPTCRLFRLSFQDVFLREGIVNVKVRGGPVVVLDKVFVEVGATPLPYQITVAMDYRVYVKVLRRGYWPFVFVRNADGQSIRVQIPFQANLDGLFYTDIRFDLKPGTVTDVFATASRDRNRFGEDEMMNGLPEDVSLANPLRIFVRNR